MQGVEILSQEVVPIISNNGFSFLVSVFVCFIIGVVLSIWLKDIDAVWCALIIGAIVGLCISPLSNVKTGEYLKLKVTISDDVILNEFNEKYEIISQEGKIYTVKEKEVNK